MGIHHTGDTVEAEAVELELLQPIPHIAHQEAKDLMVSIVEQTTVPKLVSTFATFMEIKMIRASELVDSIEDVLACVRVHNVQEHGDA